jgi:hypothetical protein
MNVGWMGQEVKAGLICVDKQGNYGGAGWGWTLVYAIQNPSSGGVQTYSVPPLGQQQQQQVSRTT